MLFAIVSLAIGILSLLTITSLLIARQRYMNKIKRSYAFLIERNQPIRTCKPMRSGTQHLPN